MWSFAVFAINVVVSARLVLQVRRSGGLALTIMK
jgi:hypothetical protein